ncbi:MAG: response regulator [Candidatus Omnitrophica bacterium]|nr:response regulator [Candidatus Omnitrophota bacterium]
MPSDVTGKKAKIAIIDDEKALVETLKSFLEERGFSVISAYDGASGLELIKREKPDIIILDITMPELDGRDVLIQLKKNEDTKSIPVIMQTVKNEPFDVDYGMELGADDYLPKPCEVHRLLKHIDAILEKRKG